MSTTILLNNGLYRITLDGGLELIGKFRDRAWHETDKAALKYHNDGKDSWSNRYNIATKHDLWEFVYADEKICMSQGVPRGLYLMYLTRRSTNPNRSYTYNERISTYIDNHGYQISMADCLLIDSIVELPDDEQPDLKDMMKHRLLHGGKTIQSFR